jgi:DNA-directed RNA polymerase III subunit RPC6
MYMLFELEPDLSITGGKWYSVEDQEFDSEFTSLLHSLCMMLFLLSTIGLALNLSSN